MMDRITVMVVRPWVRCLLQLLRSVVRRQHSTEADDADSYGSHGKLWVSELAEVEKHFGPAVTLVHEHLDSVQASLPAPRPQA